MGSLGKNLWNLANILAGLPIVSKPDGTYAVTANGQEHIFTNLGDANLFRVQFAAKEASGNGFTIEFIPSEDGE